MAEPKVVTVGRGSFLVATSTSDQVPMFRIDGDGKPTGGHLVVLDRNANTTITGEPSGDVGVRDYPEHVTQAQVGKSNFRFGDAAGRQRHLR